MIRRLALAACAVLPMLAACITRTSSSDPRAPDSYRVSFVTSRGPFTVQVTRALAPHGADRFHALVSSGYFTDCRFFRVVPGFVAQFGMNGDPLLSERWSSKPIPDDSIRETNARGTIVFAMAGPNTRASQLFVNLKDNTQLDAMGFAPLGRVVDGMVVVDSLYSGYGDDPEQRSISSEGNAYLTREFPKLDYIISARIVADSAAR